MVDTMNSSREGEGGASGAEAIQVHAAERKSQKLLWRTACAWNRDE